MRRLVAVYVRSDNLDELNKLLQDGWSPLSATPQSASSSQCFRDNVYGGWLVILEKVE